MNRFSDAGSTPAVSIGSAAAELGYVYCKSNQHPTTIEFVRCAGCSSGSAAAEPGYVYCKSNQHPTTVEFVCCAGCSVPEKIRILADGRRIRIFCFYS